MYPSNVPLRLVETKTSVHRILVKAIGDIVECPNCMDTFAVGFIKAKYTFLAGTQRKVTDEFLKEKRANHMLPDAEGIAALGQTVESFACKTATEDVEVGDMPFVVDLSMSRNSMNY